MRTRYGRIRLEATGWRLEEMVVPHSVLVVGCLLAGAWPLLAQDATAEPTGTQAVSAQPAAPVNGETPANTAGTTLDYLFNRKAGDGTAAKEAMDLHGRAKSRAIAQDALGVTRIEDPAMRARFEKFLGMAEVSQEELAAYKADMDRVLALLRANKTVDAWRQLYQLAEYQTIDAGVSWELANRIESIWNADRTTHRLGKSNEQLRQEVATANRNADMKSDSVRKQEIEMQRRQQSINRREGGGATGGSGQQTNIQGAGDVNAQAPSVDTVMGKLELTEEYLKSLEAKAKIKMNELKAEKLFEQAKTDFADYITTLFQTGRHRHVLVAADFWRKIFDQGEYPVSMAQQVNAALEIAREVDGTIEVFNHRIQEREIAAATDRLQEAFMLGEFQPSVLGLPRERKKEVEAFTRRLARMQNMIEARDFAALETLLAEMKQVAPDFDTTKPLAIVNAVKLESQLRLGKARMAAQQNDLKTAMEEFQAAAEAWPANPDLQDKALTFFNSQDTQTQSLVEFDRMVAEDNYRGIYEKQILFAPAMKDDTERQEQLRAALEKVKLAETAIEKANLMRANSDVFGAWETVELAVKDLPSDLKLNALRGELAGRGAEFVAAINKATEAEARQDFGYSLTWFAIAQQHYPASQIANQAIERLSKEIIEQASL